MILLTIDTDWAPDEATKIVLDKVKSLGLKTSVFFSTKSPVDFWPELEVGCHPDLSKRIAPGEGQIDPLAVALSEHDEAVKNAEDLILRNYREIMPGAQAVRTHRFYWHSDLSRLMVANGFRHDSSMILPYHPGICGFKVGRLLRWPVWASDHLHLARGYPLDRLDMPNFKKPGLKIFCFHVAYLYLNARSLSDFNMIKSALHEEEPRLDKGEPGIWNLFELLANEILKTSQGLFFDEIPADFIVETQIPR